MFVVLFFHVFFEVAGNDFVAASVGVEAVGEEGLDEGAFFIDKPRADVDELDV